MTDRRQMDNKREEIEEAFYNFLSHFKVIDRSLPCTHVTMDPPGKYYIGTDDIKELFTHYQNVVRKNIPVCLAEKPSPVSSFRADFDFKTLRGFGLRRQYTTEMVKKIVGFYRKEITKAVGGDDLDEQYLWCVVLEKKTPRYEGEFVKDGFHLHFPHFVCEPWACEYLQRKIMTLIRDANLFADIKTIHGTGAGAIDKICDSIARNVWLMYGSSKALDKEPFLVSCALDEKGEALEFADMFQVEMIGRKCRPLYYFPTFLSIRTAEEATPLTDAVCQNKLAYLRKKKRKIIEVSEKDEARILEDLCYIRDGGFLGMLSPNRAEDHDDWMFVGYALYNIAQGHPNALLMWDEFSKRSAKYVEGECSLKWSGMHIGDITLGSLIWIAKHDSPKKFKEWQKTDMRCLMRESLWQLQPNELKISKVVGKLFKDRFICANPSQNLWYEFANHRWKIDPGATRLKIAITETVMNHYNDYLSDLTKKFAETDGEDRKSIQKLQKKCTYVMEKLGTTRFLGNLVKMCQLQLFEEEFLKKADENKMIFGCENGVLDLQLNTFRPGVPDDHLTFSSGLNFTEYSPDAPEIQDIDDFLEKVFPNPNIRNYFLDVACSCLEGGNLNKKFIVNTGDTNGGKSKTIELLETVFGDYAINFPRELIIKGRGNSSNAPRPELARVRGRRIVTLHEIGKGESLNIGVLKAMTGNDAFFARTLHDKGGEVKPMFTLFMQCNDPPRIPENDEATWYRVRVVDYKSRFDENAPWDFEEQRQNNHYQADRHLDIAALAPPLLWKLKMKYGEYKKTGLIEPKEVKISTQQYKTSNDVYQLFIDECLEEIKKKEPLPFVRWADIQNTFRAWYKEEHPSYSKDCPGKIEMKKQFIKRLGAPNHQGRWIGYKINMGFSEADPPLFLKKGPST